MNILNTVNDLINKFRININQIIKCSDNTINDIKNEAFIIVFNDFNKIKSNERFFINELKTKCLKFNKYGKRIESKERFERFNNYENRMVEDKENLLNIDEDKICYLLDIKNIVGQDNYNYLIEYYGMGCDFICTKYHINKVLARKRASNLIKEIRGKL